MTAIREVGKINENTTLIDYGLFGVAGVGAVYLVEAGKTCLIDCGTRTEAPRIIKTLKELNAFPPDYIVITHSHWDHCQGIPVLRKQATKNITVMASEKAIPLLEDQSWNNIFNPNKNYQNVKDVIPLKEWENIDLDGLNLRIFDVPGHIKDHIAILDEKNKNIFVGDALGNKIGDQTFLPPFMPPYWNKDDFYASLDKLKQIDYDSICLAHFGYIYEDEAKKILEEARNVCDQWWQIFETAENDDKIDDVDYIVDLIMKELSPVIPEFKMEKFMMKFLLGLMNIFRKLTFKEPLVVSNILLKENVEWLIKGYKIYKNL